jgi:hypothetical protein
MRSRYANEVLLMHANKPSQIVGLEFYYQICQKDPQRLVLRTGYIISMRCMVFAERSRTCNRSSKSRAASFFIADTSLLNLRIGIITGFRTRHGLRVGYKGVRVRVAKSVPWQNPYPQRGLRVTRGVTRVYIIIVFTNNITNVTDFCCLFVTWPLTNDNNDHWHYLRTQRRRPGARDASCLEPLLCF